MAINRFMQPWKRDFSSEQYTPNFDAWAKVLAGKEQTFAKILEDADKLATLIPEGGYRTQNMRNKLLSDVRSKKDAIVSELRDTGDMTEARRKVSSVANEVLFDPRISGLKMDFELKPTAAKLATSPTVATDRQTAYDPKTGTWNQIEDPSQIHAGIYGYIPTADMNKWFYDQAHDALRPVWEKISMTYPNLQIMTAPDGTSKYYITGEKGYKEFIDVKHLMKYFDPNGEYGAYAESVYRNAKDEKRAWYDNNPEYANLDEDKKRDIFFRDLLAANLIRVYSKTQTEEFYKPMSGGDGKKEDEKTLQAIVSDTSTIVSKFDKIENIGNIVLNHQNAQKMMRNHGVDQSAKINKQLSGGDPNKKVIIRNTDGTYKINPEFDNPNILFDTKLESYGFTAYDWVAKANNEYKSLQHNYEVQTQVLEELGLNDPKLQELLSGIRQEAYKKAKVGVNAIGRTGGGGSLGGFGTGNIVDPNFQNIREPSEELIEEHFRRILAETKNQKLIDIQKKLDERKTTPFSIQTNMYYPLMVTSKDATAYAGMVSALQSKVINNLQEARNPETDELYTPSQLKVLAAATREIFANKGADNFKTEFAKDFSIKYDGEESSNKLFVTINNENVAKKLGLEKGIVTIELPLGNMSVNYGGKSESIVEWLGIEGNPQVVADMKNISQQYATSGAYRSTLQDENGTFYNVNANILLTDPDDTTVSYNFRAKFQSGNIASVNVTSPREGAVLKQFVSNASLVPNTPENRAALINSLDKLAPQIPSLSSWSVQEKDAFLNQVLGQNIAEIRETDYYSVNASVDPYIDRQLYTGFNRLAQELYTTSKVKMNVTSGHDVTRADPNSNIYNPGSPHIDGNGLDISFNTDVKRELLEIVNNGRKDKLKDFVPFKYYYLNDSIYGPIRFMYEEPQEGKNATGKHFHFERIKQTPRA